MVGALRGCLFRIYMNPRRLVVILDEGIVTELDSLHRGANIVYRLQYRPSKDCI